MKDAAAPYSLGDGPDACLLLHGLTGAPSELRPVGEALAKAGIRAVGPLLPGHGTRPDDLFKLTRHDQLALARTALRELSGARRLYLCGLSFGALLSLHLAADHDGPQIDALALLAPAIRFAGTTRLFADVLGRLPFFPPVMLNKGARDIQAGQPASDPNSPMHGDGSYKRVPLRWGRELRLLSAEALAVAPRVKAPTFIGHGALDSTASPASVEALAAALGAAHIDTRIFANSGHVLPLDREAADVCKSVVEFFQKSEG
jgi:carboxylesterase